jgi:hypothetical protein
MGGRIGELVVGILVPLGLSGLAFFAVVLMFGKGTAAPRVLGALAIMVFVIGAGGWYFVGGFCEVHWLLFKDATCW